MTSKDYKQIALDYVLSANYEYKWTYDNKEAYWEQQSEEGQLDFITNLIKKINSIGPSFLLFEGNRAIELELQDSVNRPIKVDHTELLLANEIDYGIGNFRYHKDIMPILNFDENIVLDIDALSGEDIKSTKVIVTQSDGSEETIDLSKASLEALVGDEITGRNLIIDSYKNKKQVKATNYDDKYFLSAFDDNGEWIEGEERISLDIQYPQISSKYQGLLPLIKKFIREDLLLSESSLNPTKLIKSIDIIPTRQNNLIIYINVSNSSYQSIIDTQDEEQFHKYIDGIQTELDKVEERLNRLLEDHCDLGSTIILNCRTKSEQFSIIAKKRVQEIVHQIGTLKNLTNSQYYHSDNTDWQKIQRQLIDSVYDLDRYVRLNSEEKNEIS